MGIGSEVFASVEAGRKGIGIELKESYYKQSVKNLKTAGVDKEHPSLFCEIDSIIDEELE